MFSLFQFPEWQCTPLGLVDLRSGFSTWSGCRRIFRFGAFLISSLNCYSSMTFASRARVWFDFDLCTISRNLAIFFLGMVLCCTVYIYVLYNPRDIFINRYVIWIAVYTLWVVILVPLSKLLVTELSGIAWFVWRNFVSSWRLDFSLLSSMWFLTPELRHIFV